jgi:hypothetical protein
MTIKNNLTGGKKMVNLILAKALKECLKVLIGVLIGYFIGVTVVSNQFYEMAVDHERHENAILELETHLDSCEDAWQADLAVCQIELDECNGHLEMMPD